MLTRLRTILVTRNVTWQRVSPAPYVPGQNNDILSRKRGGAAADDESTSDRDGRGVIDELDDGLTHLNDLALTCGFDLNAV